MAISNRITLEDFDRFRDPVQDTAFADVRLAASRRFLASTASGGLTPAATAGHLRDHGTGPWGAPGTAGPVHLPPTEAGADGSGVSVCMHVRGRVATTASMIAELSPHLAEGAPLRVYVAAGSPCVSIYVPAFPRTAAGPPPFVPRELSGEELWHAADALRQLVETDPDALPAIRETLAAGRGRVVGRGRRRAPGPVPLGRGGRVVGRSGPPCAPVLYPLIVLGPAVRCAYTPVCALTRLGGCHDRRTD